MTFFRKRPMCYLAIGFLLILCFAVGERGYQKALYEQESREVYLEGIVTDKEYRKSQYGSYLLVTLKKVRIYTQKENTETSFDTESGKVTGKLLEGKYLCRIEEPDRDEKISQEIKIGQKNLLSGTFVSLEEPSNPGQFNSARYYVSRGILGQFQKCVIRQQGTQYSKIREGMWSLRQRAKQIFLQQLGEDDGGLISAMLLGDKLNLNGEDKELYQRNGISHILAISGLHFSLLGMGIFNILKKLMPGHNSACVTSIFIMCLYCVFTGNSISTVRAAIMFTLSLLAGMLNRTYDSLSALGLAAILQSFRNPYVLNNSGFLLSFLAVIGVTFFGPRLQNLLEAKTKTAKSLCVSLSATLTTLPVLLTNYGVFPWYSVFLNLLVLPAMSVLLFLAMMLLGLKLWGGCEVICSVTAYLICAVLKYFEICCDVFEYFFRWDGYIGAPGKVQLLVYAVLVAVAFSRLVRHSPMAGKMLLLLAVSILTLHGNIGAEITMLDVGQGDCVVIRNTNGNVYVSDCGSSSVSSVGKYRLLPFLQYQGYGKMKGIFLSHFDNDHMNGIIELLEKAPAEKIEITYLFLPQCVLFMEEDRENLENLEALAEKNNIQIIFLKQGDSFQDHDMEFTCLYPKTTENGEVWEESRNNSSLVLNVKYHNFSLLLTGDVEMESEEEIVSYLEQMSQSGENSTGKENGKPEKEAEEIRILKVAHHGSSGASGEAFLDAVNPMLSLISCGKNNSYGHPHEETMERLEKNGSHILVTTDTGAITIRIRGKKATVECFCE